ncbi:hypothetical protein F0562_027547 [Nyssa sinensis]|uniref:non-specific serine/threonine protein kinase n=1 Tax=Nyssa sinensis TaxID=561372 RepID=A0A5J5B3V1_9ASTE|nr:hypothetical protein F0562_027547 [Nyssa sinensis]
MKSLNQTTKKLSRLSHRLRPSSKKPLYNLHFSHDSSQPSNRNLLIWTPMNHSSSVPLFWVLFFLFFNFNFTSRSFSVPFLPANNVTLFGDAYFRNNSISLTQDVSCLSPPPPPASSSPSSFSGIGRAFYVDPIRFLDSPTNTTASFSCRFNFTIVPSPLCPFGDGFVFFITSNVGSFSMSDGHMGLPELALNSQDSFVAVEFDTNFDPSLGDINDNHIGIDVNTIMSFASVDVTSRDIDLKSGRQMTAWIEYRDSEKMIRVWVGYTEDRPYSPLLVAQIDLSKQLKESMYVGFSASSGRGSAIYIVDQWRFKTFGFLPSLIPMDTVEEGDCLMCSPDDLDVENGHHTDKREGELALGIGGLAAFIVSVLVILVIVWFCMIRRKRLDSRRCNEGQIFRLQGNKVPKKLSLTEIKSATRGFNHNRIVGEGASAIVYEGSLPSCGAVAVKRFSQPNQISSSLRNPFATEFATMAGCLRHKNLIQLQGWCCERNELVLVYEYMSNGSLDKVLHRRTSATNFLTWERRLNVVLGVCSALIYLHEECERQIIHRDVKTCNIMLDAEFNAKLGDFGLAEVYEHSSTTREATLPAGTMGYLAPEYVYLGVPTVKTDVYSFGVVVLEVASGRKPVDDDGNPVADCVWDLWEKGKLIEAADSKLRGRFNRMEMERMLMVGLSCVHPNHEKRPTTREAARMLRGEAPLPVLPSRKPTVTIQSVLPEGSQEILNFGGDDPNFDDTPWATPRYCLDKLPETFDEFVYWFCENRKPKSAKKFPLGKPSSKPSTKRDHMILNDARGTHSGIKLKKKEVIYSVAETEEQRLRKSPSQQPRETHKKLDLTVCARSVDDCSPLKAKLKKKGDSCSMAKAREQRHQSSSSQQPCEAHTKLYLTKHAQLKRDCSPLNRKMMLHRQ